MPIAVLHNGQIRPLEPLPADWREGQRLRVESLNDDDVSLEEIDRDFQMLARLCDDSDPTDEERLTEALQKAHESAKEQVRKQMGLS